MLVVDAVRTKRRLSLAELARVRVELPDLQRGADQQRVMEIVRYHAERGGCCLAGGDIVLAVDSEGRRWLVDGQHRFRAALRLSEAFPNDAACIEEVDLAAPGAPTLGELFALINRAVPVPEYVISSTLGTRVRGAVDALAVRMRARFGPFLSASRSPRRPNVNLDMLLDRVAVEAAEGATLAPLLAHGDGAGAGLFAYILCVNARLGAACGAEARKRADDKARKHAGAAPLYLAGDPGMAWATDAAAVRAFLAAPAPAPAPEPEPEPEPKLEPGGVRRIPLALRNAVWNAAHGECAGLGSCCCCGKAITQQTFECGHVVAAAHGGATSVDNLRAVCRTCNRSMGTQHMDAFKVQLGFA